MLETYPAFLTRGFAVWQGFLGETGDSGLGSGLDVKAKLTVLSPWHERSLGQCWEGVPDPRSGLILGDFPPGWPSPIRTGRSSSIPQVLSFPPAIFCGAGGTLALEGSRETVPEAWHFLPC